MGLEQALPLSDLNPFLSYSPHLSLMLEWKTVTFIWHESMHDICLQTLSVLVCSRKETVF